MDLSQETALAAGDNGGFLAFRFDVPAVDQHLHVGFLDTPAFGVKDRTGQAQAVLGAGVGGPGGGGAQAGDENQR